MAMLPWAVSMAMLPWAVRMLPWAVSMLPSLNDTVIFYNAMHLERKLARGCHIRHGTQHAVGQADAV